MESTTTTKPIYELDQDKPISAFEKLMEAINNGGMDVSKRLDVLLALAEYIESK